MNKALAKTVGRTVLGSLPLAMVVMLLTSRPPAHGASDSIPPLPGALDPSFSFAPGANGLVRVALPQKDGKILIAGAFTEVNGTPRNGVARIEANGTLDSSFDPGLGVEGTVCAMALQKNGQVVLGGQFTSVNGTNRNCVARLNTDGSLDLSFDPGAGPNNPVWSIAILDDGKMIIGGDFNQISGVIRYNLARLDAQGKLDPSFTAGPTMGFVRSIALDDQQRILASGYGYQPRLLRLEKDGRLDTNFAQVIVNSWISVIKVQTDGSVLLGGGFNMVQGSNRMFLARVSSSGQLDPSFNATGGPNNSVTAIAVQKDGRILIGGGFTYVRNQPRWRMARLYSDGALDPTFQMNPGVNDWVESIEVQEDEKIIIGGNFTAVQGQTSGRAARLLGADPPPFPPVIQQPPTSQAVMEGSDVQFHVTAVGFPLPSYQWQLSGTNLRGATGDTLQLFNVRPSQAGSYSVIVSNSEGSVTSALANLEIAPAPTHPGAADVGFYSGSGPSGPILAMAVQGDGTILAGGAFRSFAGQPRSGLARLRPDGSLDSTAPALLLGNVHSIRLQDDGKILLGESTPGEYGDYAPRLIRLLPDGSLDPDFLFAPSPPMSYGVIQAIATDTQGSIYVGGTFDYRLMRLQASGATDAGFNAGIWPSGYVYALAIQKDGKVLVGGDFTVVHGVPCHRLARLNADGTLDECFRVGSGANRAVRSIAIQGDGKILIAGDFSRINGRLRSRIARLESDGTLDPDFDPGLGPNHNLDVVEVQPDGKILAGGWFSRFQGMGIAGLVRLRQDGSLDVGFSPGSDHKKIYALAQQSDGTILIGGEFNQINGVPRHGIARLLNTPTANAAPAILQDLDSQAAMAGADVTFRVVTGGDPGPFYQWEYKQQPMGENHWWLTLRNVAVDQAGPYRVYAMNAYGSAQSALAMLSVNLLPTRAGAPDLGFYSGYGPNDRVNAVILRSDRRVLIGGEFTEVDEIPRQGIARLQADGSLDASFDPGRGVNGKVAAVAEQSDGRVLIAGEFTSVNGTNRNLVARLDPNGSLDLSFAPDSSLRGTANALAVQNGGGILLGGVLWSTNFGGSPGLLRLDAHGSLDLTFKPKTFLGGTIYCITLQTNGYILVGGLFNFQGDSFLSHLVRLDPYGNLDAAFSGNGGPNGAVRAIVVQPDGNLLVAGDFSSFKGISRIGIVRLTSEGAVDPGFHPGWGMQGMINTVVCRNDGRVVVGGSFTTAGGLDYNRLVRLNANGSIDFTFDPGLGVTDGTTYYDEYGYLIDLTSVQCMAGSPDGMLVIGGDFGRVGGASRSFVARVFNQDPVLTIDCQTMSAASGGALLLRWESGVLQQTEQVTGPWADVPGSASPFLTVPTNSQQFFRVRAE